MSGGRGQCQLPVSHREAGGSTEGEEQGCQDVPCGAWGESNWAPGMFILPCEQHQHSRRDQAHAVIRATVWMVLPTQSLKHAGSP